MLEKDESENDDEDEDLFLKIIINLTNKIDELSMYIASILNLGLYLSSSFYIYFDLSI
jgi:hypothetical protein